jgi:hypothetical protein
MKNYTIKALAVFLIFPLGVVLIWLPRIWAGHEVRLSNAFILALLFAAASFFYWLQGRRMSKLGEPLVPLKLKRIEDLPQWQRDSMNRVRWRAFDFALASFGIIAAVVIFGAAVTRNPSVGWPLLGILLVLVPAQIVSFAYRQGVRDARAHSEAKVAN